MFQEMRIKPCQGPHLVTCANTWSSLDRQSDMQRQRRRQRQRQICLCMQIQKNKFVLLFLGQIKFTFLNIYSDKIDIHMLNKFEIYIYLFYYIYVTQTDIYMYIYNICLSIKSGIGHHPHSPWDLSVLLPIGFHETFFLFL